MPYIPFHIRLLDALEAALAAGLNAELVEVGQQPLPEIAFQARDFQAPLAETVAVYYDAYDPVLQAHHWTDVAIMFEVHLVGMGTSPRAINRRLMYLEFATRQVLSKQQTLGGLTRTIFVGTSLPWKADWEKKNSPYNMTLVPMICQPDERIANPERSLP